MEFSFKSLYEHVVSRWHLMVAFGLAGSLLAALITFLGPDLYEARAVVMVDQQVDLALPPSSQIDDVLYVSRETVRLEDLTYADLLWENVYNRLDMTQDVSQSGLVEDLRVFVSAPHYQDGAWYFTAEHPDPAFAAALANAWAESFVETVQSWVRTAQMEISLRTQAQTTARLRAATVDACGQLEWAGVRVRDIIDTTLSQPEVTESEFDSAVAALGQMAASVPGQPPDAFAGLSIDDLDSARQAAQSLTVALDEKLAACQARLDSYQQQEQILLGELEDAVADSFGLSPYLRVQISHLASEAERAQDDLGTAAFVGFGVAIALWLMADVSGFLDHLAGSGRDRDSS